MRHSTVAANASNTGYADNGNAWELFTKMKSDGFGSDPVTVVAVLKACISVSRKETIGEMHNLIVEYKCDSNIYMQNTLIHMYANCCNMLRARQVFDSMKDHSIVSWNALIQGYAENGQGLTSLNMFTSMKNRGFAPNIVTFMAVLKACTSFAGCSNLVGKQVHNLAVENSCDLHVYVQSTVVDMYAKCGSMVEAHQTFECIRQPTVVSWNALILGYAEDGQGQTALQLVARMKCACVSPDSLTFLAASKACSSLVKGDHRRECRYRGRNIYNLAVEKSCYADVRLQSALIDMFSKCSSMADARQVFESMKYSDVVTWTTLILGYADTGQGLTALDLYIRMRSEGPAPNYVTFMAALKACALVGGLDLGRRIHSEIESSSSSSSSSDLDVVLVTSLVDFYAKCGCLVEARGVFDSHAGTRGLPTWTALLAGFSDSGDHQTAFELFEGMQDAGFLPDAVALQCILACCSRVGLVEKGKECFDAMPTKYGIAPALEHYNCMLDILGRSNKLKEAMALLQRMPCAPNRVTWKTILGACCKWRNVAIGRLAFQSFLELDRSDAAALALMGQIYASRGMLGEQAMAKAMPSF